MGKYLLRKFNNLSGLGLEGSGAPHIFAGHYFAAVTLGWQVNCINAQAKEKKACKNAREEVKALEGGITAKSFRKV